MVGLGDKFKPLSRRGGRRVGLDDVRVSPVAIAQGVIGVAPPERQWDGVQHFAQAVPGIALSGAGGFPVAHVAQPENHSHGLGLIGNGAAFDLEMARRVPIGDGHDEALTAGA